MSGILSLVTLVVGGIIVADILTHPAGTQAASSGLATLWNSSVSGLLGNVPATTPATNKKK